MGTTNTIYILFVIKIFYKELQICQLHWIAAIVSEIVSPNTWRQDYKSPSTPSCPDQPLINLEDKNVQMEEI